jgi:hypothetical protein
MDEPARRDTTSRKALRRLGRAAAWPRRRLLDPADVAAMRRLRERGRSAVDDDAPDSRDDARQVALVTARRRD